jgi:Tol biopolymer transport system component
MAVDAASFAQGSSYIDLLPVGPGPTTRLERTGVRYFNARWLPDGKRVVVRAQEAQQQARLLS